jgi:hypothetical protein
MASQNAYSDLAAHGQPGVQAKSFFAFAICLPKYSSEKEVFVVLSSVLK